MNKVKGIVHEKLLRRKAWGVDDGDGIAKIDIRAKGRKHMEIATHEMLHILFPTMTEKEVTRAAKEIAMNLWKLHYRRIDNDTSQPLQKLKNC